MKLYIELDQFKTLEDAKNYFLIDEETSSKFYRLNNEGTKYRVADVQLDKSRNQYALDFYRIPEGAE